MGRYDEKPAATKEEAAEAKKEVAEAKKEVAEAEKKMAEAKKEVAEAKKEVAAAEKKVAEAKKEVAAAEKKVAAAEKKVAAAKKENDEDSIKSARQELNRANSFLESIYTNFQTATANFQTATANFQTASANCESISKLKRAQEDALTNLLEQTGPEDQAGVLADNSAKAKLLLNNGLRDHKDSNGLVVAFADHIKSCYDSWCDEPTRYVAAYTALFQSSGMGKTHLLLMYLTTHYGLYLCFRPKTDKYNYPPRSPVVDWLQQAPNNSKQVYFSALMQACSNEFNVWLGLADNKTPKAWYEKQQGDDGFEGFANNLIREADKLIALPGFSCDDLGWKRLSSQDRPETNFPKFDWPFLVCIDESRELSKGESPDAKLFSPVRRFFNSGFMEVSARCFLMMTDTLAHLSEMAPQSRLDSSARAVQGSLEILPVFNLVTTMDILRTHPAPRLMKGVTKWNEHRVKLGRPLWQRYLEEYSMSILSNFAKAKLTRRNDTSNLSSHDDLSKLACLGCRVVIRFFPGSQLASSLVSGHMAICLHVFPKRDALIASYASEPALTIASSALLKSNKYEGWALSLDALLEAINQGEVDTGKVGELVHRILLLLVMDMTVDASSVDVPTLYDFFVTMIGAEKVEEIFTSTERTEFRHSSILFDHFIPTTYVLSKNDIEEFFERGAAVACRPGHAGIDEELPFLSLSTGSSRYGSVVVQTKNCAAKYDSNYPESASKKLKREYAFKNTERASSNCPMVAIYHNLRSVESSISELPTLPPTSRDKYVLKGFQILGLDELDIFKKSYDDEQLRNNMQRIRAKLKEMLLAQIDPIHYASDDDKSKVELMLPGVYSGPGS